MTIISNQLVPELTVTNITKSLDFYTKLLGFSIGYQREEVGFAFIVLNDVQIMLDQMGVDRDWVTEELKFPFGRGVNFQIEVESIDPILNNLEKARIKLFMEVEEKWYRKIDKEVGNRQFLVQDPDGYLLRITESLGSRPLPNTNQ